jgi:hypothetical protein
MGTNGTRTIAPTGEAGDGFKHPDRVGGVVTGLGLSYVKI